MNNNGKDSESTGGTTPMDLGMELLRQVDAVEEVASVVHTALSVASEIADFVDGAAGVIEAAQEGVDALTTIGDVAGTVFDLALT